MLPGENGIPESLIVFVALGLSISTIVDPTKSISNPLTYAVPADTFTDNESSDGIFPSSVIWSDLKRPPLPISSFKVSAVSTIKLSIE